MITSLSWLKNHLATKANLNQVAERLTEIGLEVENIKSSNENLDNFIVCKVVKSQKHPNADKLKLCDVDIGSGTLVKVVCGAQNARDGLFAAYRYLKEGYSVCVYDSDSDVTRVQQIMEAELPRMLNSFVFRKHLRRNFTPPSKI